MKLLPQSFTANYEQLGDTLFTQVKKQEAGGLNCYVYKREKEGFLKYEVFISKRRFKGQPLPGGAVEAESRECYPKAHSFGVTAKEVVTMAQAEVEFEKFISKAGAKTEPKKEEVALFYPSGEFTMKQLLVANPGFGQPKAYPLVKKAILAGVVKEIRRVESPNGRGRAAVVYGVCSQ